MWDYTDLLSPTEYEKRDKTISSITYTWIKNIFNNLKLKFILWINFKKIRMKKDYRIKCNKYRRFKNPKIPYIFGETLTMDTPLRIDSDSMLILHQYIRKKISTIFYVISTYLFDTVSMDEILAYSLWRNFDERKMSVVSTYIFFGIISMAEKLMWFWGTFFDLILVDEKSTLFWYYLM